MLSSGSQNFRDLAVLLVEPVLLEGAGDGAEGVAAAAARIRHLLLGCRPVSEADARHTRYV